jgi:hypothetical protein
LGLVSLEEILSDLFQAFFRMVPIQDLNSLGVVGFDQTPDPFGPVLSIVLCI